MVEEDRYWPRIEEMKALVEPLPLVPAMCIAFSRSKSDGCHSSQLGCVCRSLLRRSSEGSHLISNAAAPFYHLGYRVLVRAHTGFSELIDNGKVRLQRIQGSDGVLFCWSMGVSEGGTVAGSLRMCGLPSLQALWKGTLVGIKICARGAGWVVRGTRFCASAHAG